MIHAKMETILKIIMDAVMTETDPGLIEMEVAYQLAEIDQPEDGEEAEF